MEETKEVVESSQEDSQEQVFFSWKNRSFKTQDELSSFLEGMALSQGKASQENDQLKREIEPFRKLGAQPKTIDQADLAKKVVALAEEGRHEEAIKLQFDYTNQILAGVAQEKAEDAFWREYTGSRQDIFEHLPEDMARDYVFKNYRDELYNQPDQFEFLDRVLKPKVSKFIKPEAKASDSDVFSPIAKGKSGAPVKSTNSSTQEAPDTSRDAALNKLGFR